MSDRIYPLTFRPVFKDYIWGGRNLARFGRDLPPGRVAESWEIAAHEDGTTLVENGRFAGQSLLAVQEELGLDLIGRNNRWAYERDKFPLLIKLLDANRPLSVQVHPNDGYALEHEGNELGKTEMWVVLDAADDARIILGVKEGVTTEEFAQAIHDGRLEPHLHEISLAKGDFVCVPAGSLHAILGGLVIAEIQQNSNTTYRVYDWNRVQDDGTPRPLHVRQALDVINFDQVEPSLPQPQRIAEDDGVRRALLCGNDYFITERVEMADGSSYHGRCDGSTLEIWGVIDGRARVQEREHAAVGFVLLPAALGDFTVTAVGDAVLLRTYCP